MAKHTSGKNVAGKKLKGRPKPKKGKFKLFEKKKKK